ncbi:PREDICTED: THAP domain-containing protein 5-like [Trachymyrmex septentrionalis]|nr:PREDICTED: THAP domain-containing protein 5-like [Trachymyrmex septentrionalis]
MPCSVKKCVSNLKSKSKVHSFRFPLNDKNRLDKWIAAVGKPDWKPTKASRICNLHFNKKDIIEGMGYQRSYLRKNAVPKDYSSFVTENELVDTVTLKPKKVCNITSINKSININETCNLKKSVAWDSNNLKNNVSTIENNRSNTFDIRDQNQSVQKTIPHPNTYTDEKYKFIQTYSKEICNSASIKSVSSSETCVFDKNAVRNHTNLKNDVNTTIENYGLYIFDTENQNQSIKNTISHLDKKCSFFRSDSNEIYNCASSNKSVSSNEIYVSEKSVALDHNYSKYHNIIMKKNDGSNIFGTRNLNPQAILQPGQKRKFIRIGLKNVPILPSSINFNYKIRREIDFINATKKINELSKNVKDMKVKNRTLQQKLRRYNERVTLIKKLFDLLQQEKLISGDSLQLIRKQLERLILQTSQNKNKNESQLQIRTEN